MRRALRRPCYHRPVVLTLFKLMVPFMLTCFMLSRRDELIERYSATPEERRERNKWNCAVFLYAVLGLLLSAEAVLAGHTVLGYVLGGLVWLLCPLRFFASRVSTHGLGPYAGGPGLPRLIGGWLRRQICYVFNPHLRPRW